MTEDELKELRFEIAERYHDLKVRYDMAFDHQRMYLFLPQMQYLYFRDYVMADALKPSFLFHGFNIMAFYGDKLLICVGTV